MIALKGTYEDGRLALAEPSPVLGPVEVLVVFPEAEDDPWKPILEQTTPRPKFVQFIDEILKDYADGKTEPMDFDQL